MESSPIKIMELKKTKDKEYKPPSTPPDLPQLHFAMCIVGPRNRGKSLLIRNLLLRKDLLKNTFKKPNYIIIISPSVDINGDYDEVDGANVYKYDTYDPELIDFLMDRQKQIINQYGRKKCPEILLVLDDVLDSGALDYHSKIEKIFSRGRHLNLNIILVSQHLNRISRCMRCNCDYVLSFLPNNETSLLDFLEQYLQKKYHWGMSEYLKQMWSDNIYEFLLVDFKTSNANRRFRKGFSEPIILDELPKKPSSRK